MRSLLKKLTVVTAAVMLPSAVPAMGAVFPAGEFFTEPAGAGNWGAFAGVGFSGVAADAADKTTGDASIKYQGFQFAAGSTASAQPALVMAPTDFSAFAGGTFSFDLKLSDVTGLNALSVTLWSTGGGEAIHNPAIPAAGWQTYDIDLPANEDFTGGVWGVYGFNPESVERILFTVNFTNGSGETVLRDISFDNVHVEYVPEPAVLSFAGLAGLMLLRGRRRSGC